MDMDTDGHEQQQNQKQKLTIKIAKSVPPMPYCSEQQSKITILVPIGFINIRKHHQTSENASIRYPIGEKFTKFFYYAIVSTRGQPYDTMYSSVEIRRFNLNEFGVYFESHVVGYIDLRGFIGHRLWPSVSGDHFYAICTNPAPENCNQRMKLEEKPIPDTHSVYLTQFDIQTLQRKDFSFSERPIFGQWMGNDARQLYFLSDTNAILISNTQQWEMPHQFRYIASSIVYHLTIHMNTSTIRLNQIEIPNPPPEAFEPACDVLHPEQSMSLNWTICVHLLQKEKQRNNTQQQNGQISTKDSMKDDCSNYLFYNIDKLNTLRVFNETDWNWEEYAIEQKYKDDLKEGKSAVCTVMECFGGDCMMLMTMEDRKRFQHRLRIFPVRKAYRIERLFKSNYNQPWIDGSTQIVFTTGEVNKFTLHYISPPLIFPLKYLAFWYLQQYANKEIKIQQNNEKNEEIINKNCISSRPSFQEQPIFEIPTYQELAKFASDQLKFYNKI